MRLLSQAADGQVKFQVEFFQIEGRQVAHLHVLEVLPRSLDRIQVRCVRRQPFDSHTTSSGAGQEVFNRDTPVDRRPIPDHQQSTSDVPDQVLEKLDGVKSIEGLLAHQDVELAGRRNAAHDREVIARLPLMEDRSVSLGCVRPHLTRQKVEARFVHENKGAALRRAPRP